MSHAERQMHIDDVLEQGGVEEEIDFDTPGKQSGSDGGAEKTDEELREEKETKRLMASEKSVH